MRGRARGGTLVRVSAQDQVAGVARLFDTIADEYDQAGVPFFGPVADGLVRAVAPQQGERALDLGCGRGAVTTLLADAVLPGGSVTALDVSPAMAAHTSALLGDRVEVVVGDATDPALPAHAYDVVLSSLVLFFLPDPAAALARWVGLLAPGGRLGVSTFGPVSTGLRELDAVLQPFMPPLDPRSRGPESPFASDASMERLLVGAGATDVRTVGGRVVLDVPDAAAWHRWSRTLGQRAAWVRMDEAETARALEDAAPVLARAHAADGLWQDLRYTLGTAPA